MLQKVSLSEVNPMLQSSLVELSTEVVVKVRVTLDNIEEGSSLPKPVLTTLVHFLSESNPLHEYAVMSDGTYSDITCIEDVSKALNISLDNPVWEMRFIEAE